MIYIYIAGYDKRILPCQNPFVFDSRFKLTAVLITFPTNCS